MHPALFEVGGVAIHSYGVLLALGYLAAHWIMRSVAPNLGIPKTSAGDLALWGFLAGLVGARALYAAIHLDSFLREPAALFRLWNGGLVFYGGLMGAGGVVLVWSRANSIPWKSALDLSSVGVCAGHIFGRVGCLLAGCCHGDVCRLPWAVVLQSDLVREDLRGAPLHPVQAYEAIALALLCTLLLKRARTHPAAGSLSFLYLMSYASIRLVTEMFRGDSARGFLGPLSTSQIVSLMVLAAGAVFQITSRARRRA